MKNKSDLLRRDFLKDTAVGARLFGAGVAVAVCAALCWASVQLVILEAPALPVAWRG